MIANLADLSRDASGWTVRLPELGRALPDAGGRGSRRHADRRQQLLSPLEVRRRAAARRRRSQVRHAAAGGPPDRRLRSGRHPQCLWTEPLCALLRARAGRAVVRRRARRRAITSTSTTWCGRSPSSACAAKAGSSTSRPVRSASFRTVAETLRRLADDDCQIVTTPRRNPVTHRRFDVSRLHAILPEWRPTPLEAGLAATLADAQRTSSDAWLRSISSTATRARGAT